MKISLNWIKKYVDIKIPADELIPLIGSRLVEVEGVIDETHKYDNIYIARVEKAEKIEGTHLTLCEINVGKPELVQVVCGAPNVREGMLAVWIAPGATVPASVHEDAPFIIGRRKMLGKYESNGMLAGADELDFDDRHEKIVEIDPTIAKPGDLLADVFDLRDVILEIENKSLTHRPDCFGIIGFAREVAGILGQKFGEPTLDEVTGTSLASLPEAELSVLENSPLAPKITISDPSICPRYTALILEKHGDLKPKYLTEEAILIAKSGMRPIDPIVDATNYFMLLTGQPLHAFDYDKFIAMGSDSQATPHIHVRVGRPGETLTLLDDKTIELTDNDIIIASGDTPVALAGAMGGLSTAIDDSTRRIILESATFSLYHLRRTQMAHGIFSEAITRFTKGQPPYQTLAVATASARLLGSGFKITSAADDYPEPEPTTVVKIWAPFINSLLGTNYTSAEITTTLENVGFVVAKDKDALTITVPAWRTDIHIPEDIAEEVGRLNGYDNITPTLPLHATASVNQFMAFKTAIRDALRRLGANEILTYSFVSSRLLENAGMPLDNSYRIVNSISPELQYIRQSLTPSLLSKAYLNQKIPFDKFALFEMNQVYQKVWGLDPDGVPTPHNHLSLVLAERKNQGTPFYAAKHYLERLLEELNLTAEIVPFEKSDLAITAPYEPKHSALLKNSAGHVFGIVGEFKNSVHYDFKLAPYAAGFELDLDTLFENYPASPKIYLGPIEKRDLTLITANSYAETVAKIQKVLEKHKVIAKITPLGIYQPGDDPNTPRNISFHLEFHAELSEKHLARIMQDLEKLSDKSA